MAKTIQELASDVCDDMVYDEDRKIYHQKKPGDPQWIQDMIYACHYNGMLPDDFVFEQVFNLCSEISRLEPDDDPLDIEVHADEYSHSLLKWVSSNLARADFVDDAIDDSHWGNERSDFFRYLGVAQEKEMQEILYTIINKLEERVDELQDSEIDVFREVCKDEIS
jgi:hypothetical protein